mgnify:CR=1 FL=1
MCGPFVITTWMPSYRAYRITVSEQLTRPHEGNIFRPLNTASPPLCYGIVHMYGIQSHIYIPAAGRLAAARSCTDVTHRPRLSPPLTITTAALLTYVP